MKKNLILVLALLASCSSKPIEQTQNSPSSSTTYQRGTTNYTAGQASVTDQNVNKVNPRNYDGLRVAGPDTDLVVSYWDSILRVSGARIVFSTFRSRYKDLIVLRSGAEDAALREFRIWARSKGLEDEFNAYWLN